MQLVLFTALAATVQGAAGFGFGLIATTGFVWVLATPSAVPLVIVLSLCTSAALAIELRAYIDRPLATRLVVGAALGLPLGLLLFRALDAEGLMIVVSVVVLFTVVLLARRSSHEGAGPARRPPGARAAIGVGALGGALTISIGMPGPPVVLYLSVLRTSKDVFRATTLAFFVGSYAVSLLTQVAVGAVDAFVWSTAAVLLPVALAGAWIGHLLSKVISEESFHRVALVLIALIGASALASVVLG